MKEEKEKLEELAETIANDVRGCCLESGVVIGKVGNVYFKLIATKELEDDEVLDRYRCIEK
jgi:hypothetical protein